MNFSLLKKANNLNLLLFLTFFCSAVIRFHDLGNIPLNDGEANLALSALSLTKGDFSNLIPHPLYLTITSLFIQFFSANNITTRIFPALIGSIFPLLPYLYKKWFGATSTILLSVLLIFDPILISLSRQADSRILTMFFFVLLAASVLQEKLILSGIAAGLFILTGLYAWYLTVVIFLTLLIYANVTKFQKNKWGAIAPIVKKLKKKEIFIISALICGLLIGSGFTQHPQLINSVIQGLVGFIEGWFKGELLNKNYLLIVAFITSYLLFIVFFFIGLVIKHGKFSHTEATFLIYGTVTLFFLIEYPAASQCDVVFFLPFFYFFVCKGILRWWLIIQKNYKQSILIGIPVMTLVGFIWLAALRILNLPLGSIEHAQMLVAIIGSIFLIGLILLLIGWGWSLKTALNGFSLGLIAILFLFQVSVNFHSFSPSRRPDSDIWWSSTYVDGSNLMMKTIEEVSLWNTGIRNGLEIQIQGIDSPSLLWLLRENKVFIGNVIHPGILPPVIITKTKDNPLLEESYRGQKTPYYSEPIWIQNLPHSLVAVDFYRWLFFRDSMMQQDVVFIWVKANLFVGNNLKFESRVS